MTDEETVRGSVDREKNEQYKYQRLNTDVSKSISTCVNSRDTGERIDNDKRG